MAFINAVFPSGINVGFGTAGGPGFATKVGRTDTGNETRNSKWDNPLNAWKVVFSNLKQSEFDAVSQFFGAARGRFNGFLFLDPIDSVSGTMGGTPAATDESIGTGDNIETDFQLVKTYTAGAEVFSRTITRPQTGTVLVALDGVPQVSGWSVSTTTGIVSFVAAPGIGVAVTAGFAFYYPARFDTDMLEQTISAKSDELVISATLPVVELRE